MEVTWFLAALVFVLVAINFRIRTRFRTLLRALPSPPCNPIFGHALMFLGGKSKRTEIGDNLFRNYVDKGILLVWLGPIPYVLLLNAEAVEPLLSSTKHIKKGVSYNFLRPWLGLGLLTSSGPKWASRRKMLTPAFHFRILEDFVPIFNEQSKILVNNLKSIPPKRTDKLFQLVTLCTLDIICSTAMGCNMGAQTKADSDYVNAIYKASEQIFLRMIRPWLFPDFIFNMSSSGREHAACLKILHDFTKKVIKEKRAEVATKSDNIESENEDKFYTSKKRLAFLDLLLEYSQDGKVLSDSDIQEEVDTFMFEGHDTTSAGIFWTLYALGMAPHIQEKVHKEVDDIFGEGNTDKDLTSEDVKNLKYLGCVCKEVLRMVPSVPIFSRLLTEDLHCGDYTVPAGIECAAVPVMVQRDEKHWKNPDVFDPDRFLPENCRDRHPYAFIPFSAGPRNCIGQKFALMEEKVVVAHVMRHFSIRTLHLADDIRASAELILRPLPETYCRLIPRKLKSADSK